MKLVIKMERYLSRIHAGGIIIFILLANAIVSASFVHSHNRIIPKDIESYNLQIHHTLIPFLALKWQGCEKKLETHHTGSFNHKIFPYAKSWKTRLFPFQRWTFVKVYLIILSLRI